MSAQFVVCLAIFGGFIILFAHKDITYLLLIAQNEIDDIDDNDDDDEDDEDT